MAQSYYLFILMEAIFEEKLIAMKNVFFGVMILVGISNSFSQSVHQQKCPLKSENLKWLAKVKQLNRIDLKLKFIKDRILADSMDCLKAVKRKVLSKESLNQTITEYVKAGYEKAGFNCNLFFVLTIKGKFASSLNEVDKSTLKLIQTKGIDSITTITENLTHLLYGRESGYCGTVFLNSSNRKLKRKIKRSR